MPDFQNFKIEKLQRTLLAEPNILQFRISLQICDSNSGEVLKDFTGTRAILFPNILMKLPDEDQQELIELITNWLINKKIEGKV